MSKKRNFPLSEVSVNCNKGQKINRTNCWGIFCHKFYDGGSKNCGEFCPETFVMSADRKNVENFVRKLLRRQLIAKLVGNFALNLLWRLLIVKRGDFHLETFVTSADRKMWRLSSGNFCDISWSQNVENFSIYIHLWSGFTVRSHSVLFAKL
jgi:hypothetical protein